MGFLIVPRELDAKAPITGVAGKDVEMGITDVALELALEADSPKMRVAFVEESELVGNLE